MPDTSLTRIVDVSPGSDGAGALNAAEQGFADLRTGLLVLYTVLLVLIPIASYLMARAALAPLQRSYEMQQRFVDGASHEMRRPLSIIQVELELALKRRYQRRRRRRRHAGLTF